MADSSAPVIDDRWILAQRGPKNVVDPLQPYGCFVENEYAATGRVEPVATVLLSNRECPFRCLMCDLWKNTTDRTVPADAIAGQIRWAMERLDPARHLKLYNSGNFFDAKAIPTGDHPAIAAEVAAFETVIVENHPRLVDDRCLAFRDLLRPRLEIAMGLETAHPDVLRRLNKRMTLADFRRACQFLGTHAIAVRAFILVRPPFLDEAQGVEWGKRSIDFAFDAGVECCTVIPTRAGNGAMDRLQRDGWFAPPGLESLEEVVQYGIGLGAGRVFADLWDADVLALGEPNGAARLARLRLMNLTQTIPATPAGPTR